MQNQIPQKFIVDEKGILHKIDKEKVKDNPKFTNTIAIIDIIIVLSGLGFISYGITLFNSETDSNRALFFLLYIVIGFSIWLVGIIIYLLLRKDKNWKDYLRKSLLLRILNYLVIFQIVILILIFIQIII